MDQGKHHPVYSSRNRRAGKTFAWGVAAEYVYGGTLGVNKQGALPVTIGCRGDLVGSFNDTAMFFISGNLNWRF